MYASRVDLAHGNSATFTRRFGINIWFPEYKNAHTVMPRQGHWQPDVQHANILLDRCCWSRQKHEFVRIHACTLSAGVRGSEQLAVRHPCLHVTTLNEGAKTQLGSESASNLLC